jgi:hypothetical protein
VICVTVSESKRGLPSDHCSPRPCGRRGPNRDTPIVSYQSDSLRVAKITKLSE